MSHGRRALCLVALLVSSLLLSLGLAAPRAEAASVKAPTGLTAVSTASTSVRLTWSARSGVAKYRIKFDDNKKFSSPSYKTSASNTIELTGLKAKRSYWIKVRAMDAKGKFLSGYGKTLKVTTRSKTSFGLLSPIGLKATEATTAGATLGWTARGTTNRYRIQYSTSSKMTSPKYVKVTGTSGALTGLKPATTYYAKVRVIDSSGNNLSQYSPSISFKTATFDGPPAGLAVTGTSTTTATLTWTPLPGAPGYRLKYDTNPWNSSKYAFTTGNSVTLTKLSPGTDYWVKIRVMKSDGTFLTDYSSKVKFTTTSVTTSSTPKPTPTPTTTAPTPTPTPTPTPAPTPTPTATIPTTAPTTAPPIVAPGSKPPAGLTVTSVSPTSVGLAWTPIPGAPRYRVKYDVNPWNSSQYAHTTDSSLTLNGLTPRTTYSFKVRVMDLAGNFLTDYGTTVTATTPAEPTPLVVGSYNVRCHNCHSGLAEEKPWTTRRSVVVETIKSQDPDVIGLQEAQQSWLINADGSTQNKSQFEDLVERLGSPWALTNTHRNNCVKSTTPTGCVYQDRGASKGTKIIYRTDRLKLVSQGSVELSRVTPSAYDRYLAWAIFEQRATGQRFFFGDTHLEPDNDAAGKTVFHDHRARQAQDILAALAAKNPDGLPVVLVGDLASSRADEPTNAPYDVLTKGGLIDPLGNVKGSTTPVKPTVETRINTNYYSFNGWARRARRTTTQINGTYVDYILTTPMRVEEWETVVNVDNDGVFIGTIPSDHNMLRATLWLPSPAK